MLTDEDLCAEDNVCYCVAFGLNTSGSKSYADEDYLHDGDTVEASAATPLSGVSLLQLTYGTAETITFTVECARTKGNVRIVLLDENLDIIHDFSVTEKSSYTVNNAKGKEFEIRVAGESAEFTINVSREFKTEENPPRQTFEICRGIYLFSVYQILLIRRGVLRTPAGEHSSPLPWFMRFIGNYR